MEKELPVLANYYLIHVDTNSPRLSESDMIAINSNLNGLAEARKLNEKFIMATFIFPDNSCSVARYYPI